jgi:hypothetical protein
MANLAKASDAKLKGRNRGIPPQASQLPKDRGSEGSSCTQEGSFLLKYQPESISLTPILP